MENDIGERGILVMLMRAPTVGKDVHFHVADPRRLRPELNDCSSEIRPTFAIQKTGMKHTHCFSVQRFQLIADNTLMSPDRLEQPLGRRVAFLPQNGDRAALQAQLRVGIAQGRKHLAIAFARTLAQSQ